jgi:hypothetical protein
VPDEKPDFVVELDKVRAKLGSVRPEDRFRENSDGKGPRSIPVVNEQPAKDRDRGE